MKNNYIAIIPARGGSKRIPRKNIKLFLGKPIIAYSIEKALNSGLFEEVMVSTDDNEIAEAAIQYGAKVPFYRSTETSGDFVTTITVIHEVLREYRNQFNKIFDLVCCVYPTAPLIKIQHLKEGLELLNSKNYDSVYPVVSYGYPVWRGVEISKGGKSKMIWPEYQNYRSQDLKTVYHDAGQWYWMNIGRLKDSVFTQNSASIVLSESEVQDVDTYVDWTLAELKYKLSNEV